MRWPIPPLGWLVVWSFISVQLAILYCAAGAIKHRATLFIVKRNPAVFLSELTSVSIINLVTCWRWLFLVSPQILASMPQSSKQRWLDVYGQLNDLAFCLSGILLTGGGMMRIQLIVLKFREQQQQEQEAMLTMPQPNSRQGGRGTAAVLFKELRRRLTPEVRTTGGQHLALAYMMLLTLLASLALSSIRTKCCLHICKAELPIVSASLWFTVPLGLLASMTFTGTLTEFGRLGLVEDDLGVIKGARMTTQVASAMVGPEMLSMLLADFRVGQPYTTEAAAVGQYVRLLGLLYASHLQHFLKRPELALFPPTVSRIHPDLVVEPALTTDITPTQEPTQRDPHQTLLRMKSSDSALAKTSIMTELTATTKHTSSSWLAATMTARELDGLLPALVEDEERLERLYVLARRMLSEEAVRCAVLILKIRVLSLSIPDRQRMRQLWCTIHDMHTGKAAPMPVNLDEATREPMDSLLVRALRRKVVFADDCITVKDALDQLLEMLAPGVEPVLTRFFADEEGGGTPGRQKSSSGGGRRSTSRHSTKAA